MIEDFEIAVIFSCGHNDFRRAMNEEDAKEHRRSASSMLCFECQKEWHRKRRHHHRHTTRISIQFGENAMNAVKLTVGQKTTGTIVPLEADGVTPTPGAVVSAQSYTISDPSLEAVTNADGTLTITGIAASTGAVSGTADAIVTDADGAVKQFSQTFTVTVDAVVVPPVGLTTSIGVEFSTPA